MALNISSSLFMTSQCRFVRIDGIVPAAVHLKLEGLNAAGSIKLKPAMTMIADLEAQGRIKADTRLIESSSGNLGVALSMVCANKGYRFTCVTDPNASPSACKAMRAMGSEVIVVTERDAHGGYLNTRIRLIETMCEQDPRTIWLNQYASASNWRAHYDKTARELAAAFAHIDCLFIGAGTTGTLTGCAKYFKQHRPATRIVAVDAAGSITFGGPARRRHIPGLGTSRRPEILDESLIDDVIYASESETIAMCRELGRKGMLVGGSTGSVMAGVRKLAGHIQSGDIIVAISPDMAEKYLDSIYDDNWVKERFPDLMTGNSEIAS